MPIKHGAYSDRVVSERAAQVRRELDWMPWLADEDPSTLSCYCRAEARAQLLSEYFFADFEQEAGTVPLVLFDAVARAENRAERLATELGLNLLGRRRRCNDLAKRYIDGGRTDSECLDRLVAFALGEVVRTGEMDADERRLLLDRLGDVVPPS
ncbi:MAG: hypothetical protein ABSE77_06605 [Acidimicrobiales bacterium]|jgi:hypothetical protein